MGEKELEQGRGRLCFQPLIAGEAVSGAEQVSWVAEERHRSDKQGPGITPGSQS